MRPEQTYVNSFNKNKIMELIDECNDVCMKRIMGHYDYIEQTCELSDEDGTFFKGNQFIVIKKLRDMIDEQEKK